MDLPALSESWENGMVTKGRSGYCHFGASKPFSCPLSWSLPSSALPGPVGQLSGARLWEQGEPVRVGWAEGMAIAVGLESGEVWGGQGTVLAVSGPLVPPLSQWLPTPPPPPALQLYQQPSSLPGWTWVYVCGRQWRGRGPGEEREHRGPGDLAKGQLVAGSVQNRTPDGASLKSSRIYQMGLG